MQSSTRRYSLANGSFETSSEIVQITVRIADVNFRMSASVMNGMNTQDLLLGINFIKMCLPEFDWRNQSMTIDPAKFKSERESDIVLVK